MCAQLKDKSVIEFLCPPEGSQPGDLVFFEGYERKPDEVLKGKGKEKLTPYDRLSSNFITDDSCVGVFSDDGKNIPF